MSLNVGQLSSPGGSERFRFYLGGQRVDGETIDGAPLVVAARPQVTISEVSVNASPVTIDEVTHQAGTVCSFRATSGEAALNGVCAVDVDYQTSAGNVRKVRLMISLVARIAS